MSEASSSARTKADYKTSVKPIWCPGCGDYGVLDSVYQAMADRNMDPEKCVFVSGIGCSSRLPYFVNSYAFHGVHGRALPIAMGVKIANPDLDVFIVGGDGDGFSIGGGHIPHVARRNVNLTYLVMDNSIYGLTKGQVAPTSSINMVTGSTPYGSAEQPIHPVAMLIIYGATFVGQAFSARPKQLTELVGKAIDHPGFALINVLSPCPTFNKIDTFKAYKDRVVEIDPSHDPSDKMAALQLAMAPDKRYVGLFYQEKRPTYEVALREVQVKAGLRKEVDVEGYFARYS